MNVPVTGVKVGSAVIQASNANITAVSASVTVIASTAISLPAGLDVGMGQTMPFAVTLPSPAPAGGVTIALVSSDLTKLTISPASVFVSAGATAPYAQPQISGAGLGTASITASAPSYLTSDQTVQVVSQVSFSPSSLTIGGTATQNFTLNLMTPAPAPGLTVMLNSSNTGVASVPATVVFATGSSSVSVPVTGVSAGSATITATTPAFRERDCVRGSDRGREHQFASQCRRGTQSNSDLSGYSFCCRAIWRSYCDVEQQRHYEGKYRASEFVYRGGFDDTDDSATGDGNKSGWGDDRRVSGRLYFVDTASDYDGIHRVFTGFDHDQRRGFAKSDADPFRSRSGGWTDC